MSATDVRITAEPIDNGRCKFLVSEPIVSGNLVTVVKRSPAPWPVAGKAVGQAIRAALAGGQPPVTSKPAAPAGRGSAADDALYERVAELFDSQVNPMVAR